MLALRLLLALAGIALVISVLGYALSRDRRWLRYAGIVLKGGVAVVALIMLAYLMERLLLVV